VIEVRGLNVLYPETHALWDVNLSIASGSFVLIGGPSGGGKSTLAHAMMGLLAHETNPSPVEMVGHILVKDLDPQQHGVARLVVQAGLNLVFQNPATQLFNGTVEEEIAFGPRNLALPMEEISARVQYGLQATGCLHLRDRPVRHLSGGEQQRVAIAACLAMRPLSE
jgi:energy-coupling factor transporter ATP-binding protein EcfA2